MMLACLSQATINRQSAGKIKSAGKDVQNANTTPPYGNCWFP